MNEVAKVQVSIREDLLQTAKAHPLFQPGKKEGQGVVGLLNFALSWALAPAQEGPLTAYQASFELERLQAQKAELEARIAALSPAPSPFAEPAKPTFKTKAPATHKARGAK